MNIRDGIHFCPKNFIQISGDSRFLAVPGEFRKGVLFELATGKVIGMCDKYSFPRFQKDNQTVLFSTIQETEPEIISVNVTDEQFNTVSLQSRLVADEEFFFLCKDHIVTAKRSVRNLNWLMKASEKVHDQVRSWLADVGLLLTIKLHFRNPVSFQIENEITIPTRNYQGGTPYGELCPISVDGGLLAMDEGSSISVWNLQANFGYARWVIICCVILFCCFLCRPRKVLT